MNEHVYFSLKHDISFLFKIFGLILPTDSLYVFVNKAKYMKRLTLTGIALLLAIALHSQVEDDWKKSIRESQNAAIKEFEQFMRQANQEYEDFRRKANEDYAKFMEESWKMFEIQPAEEPPAKPKPPVPVFDDTEPAPTPDPEPRPETRPVTEPVRIPDPIQILELPNHNPDKKPERPKPIDPIVPNAIPMSAAQNVFLYGSPFAFHFDREQPLHLEDASEKSVAKMWRQLSDPSFDPIIAECLQQRDECNLCDWAYVKLTQQVAEKQFGEGTNEAVVMQMYLLTQSGYQMRIGRDKEDRLFLMIGSKEQIYRYQCFKKEEIRYYIIDRSFNKKELFVYDHAFPQETTLSLALTQPKLQESLTEKRTVTSERYPDVTATVQTNTNLIAFYNDYPQCSMWNYYSVASLSDVMKESLYPALRQAIEGKTELQAANILLNFVQTGFKYQTDDEQFGYERPLFPDETFYYPYCDCEDRSILFTCLVRELLGLDVVLLNYPEHLATAVCFNEEVKGDYLLVGDKTYMICDPTYINAPVGCCAPKFKSVSPTVVRL
jgi:outer membrane biosynthesis protein TonB